MIQIDADTFHNIQASLYLFGSLMLMCGLMMYVPNDIFMPPKDKS